MSGLKPITVNTAPEADPHIYAEDDAAIYQSIFGSDGVMTIGQQCASQVISNNKVRVKDGVIIVGGHVARIPYGEYIDCEIANGQSGKNRNDIIIAKFVTTGSGGIDTYTCEVKQGVAGSSASDPALTQNDLYAGGKIREMPLYRVKIEGLSIVAVEQLFKLVPTIPELEEQLAELNSKMPVIQSGTDTLAYANYAVCTARVYFPEPFEEIPDITITPIVPSEGSWNSTRNSITNSTYMIAGKTNEYFDVRSFSIQDDYTESLTIQFDWMAKLG